MKNTAPGQAIANRTGKFLDKIDYSAGSLQKEPAEFFGFEDAKT